MPRSTRPISSSLPDSFDSGTVDHVRNQAGVRQAEGVFSFTLRYHAADGKWKPIEIQAIPQNCRKADRHPDPAAGQLAAPG